jgi:hypothetical protein
MNTIASAVVHQKESGLPGPFRGSAFNWPGQTKKTKICIKAAAERLT